MSKRIRFSLFALRFADIIVIALMLWSAQMMRAAESQPGTDEILKFLDNNSVDGVVNPEKYFCRKLRNLYPEETVATWSKDNRLVLNSLCGSVWKKENQTYYDAVKKGSEASGGKLASQSAAHRAAMQVMTGGKGKCYIPATLGASLKSLGPVTKDFVCKSCSSYFDDNKHPKAKAATCGTGGNVVQGTVVTDIPVMGVPVATPLPSSLQKSPPANWREQRQDCKMLYTNGGYASCTVNKYNKPQFKGSYDTNSCNALYQQCINDPYMLGEATQSSKIKAAQAQLAKYGKAAGLVS